MAVDGVTAVVRRRTQRERRSTTLHDDGPLDFEPHIEYPVIAWAPASRTRSVVAS